MYKKSKGLFLSVFHCNSGGRLVAQIKITRFQWVLVSADLNLETGIGYTGGLWQSH